VAGLVKAIVSMLIVLMAHDRVITPDRATIVGCIQVLPFFVYLIACAVIVGGRYEISGARAAWLGFLVVAVTCLLCAVPAVLYLLFTGL
jgi:hypothetical protein